MRYVIFGAGAIGGVIGGRLHAAGHDVVLVARGEHLTALQRDGLRLRTPDGEERLAVTAVGSVAELGLTADDVVFLTVKSQDTVAALDDLRAAAPPDIAVVCAQNGIANEPEALRRFRNVYGVCVILPSQFTQPGVVAQQSSPLAGVLDLGRFPSGTDALAERIAADLTGAGFRAMADPAIMAKKRRKLLMNVGNALDALCGWEARGTDLYVRAQDEGVAVLAAAGLDVQAPEDEHERRQGISVKPVEGQDRGGSSSWQSLARGTGSIETDHLNGEVVLLGRLHGVATPVNEALQRVATAAARTGRAAGSVPLEELTALLA
jgi:2-dehydropantoate 2-reductase